MHEWYGLTFGDPRELRSLRRCIAARHCSERGAHRRCGASADRGVTLSRRVDSDGAALSGLSFALARAPDFEPRHLDAVHRDGILRRAYGRLAAPSGARPRHLGRCPCDSGLAALAAGRSRRRSTAASSRALRDERDDGVSCPSARVACDGTSARDDRPGAALGVELGGQRIRLADAPKLGPAARRSRVRRQCRRVELGRVQRAGRHRSGAGRSAHRLGRRRGRVLFQCGARRWRSLPP